MSYKQNRQVRLGRGVGFDARQVTMFSDPAKFAGLFLQDACRFAAGWFVDLISETVPQGSAPAARLRRSPQMRIMYIVTSPRPPGPPTPELMEAIHKLADREIKAGRMLDSGGLMPIAAGAQVRIADGQLSVVDGPFVEAKEVIGGYAIFELPGKEEAVASAVEFMQLHRDLMPSWEGTCEVRTFMGP
jgi:hypothetical protein